MRTVHIYQYASKKRTGIPESFLGSFAEFTGLVDTELLRVGLQNTPGIDGADKTVDNDPQRENVEIATFLAYRVHNIEDRCPHVDPSVHDTVHAPVHAHVHIVNT